MKTGVAPDGEGVTPEVIRNGFFSMILPKRPVDGYGTIETV
jgi:hypothetical protein